MKAVLVAIAFLFATNLFADFPKNDLWKQDRRTVTLNVSQSQFDAAIAEARQIYAPIVQRLGGNLVLTGDWNDSTVNAYASREGNDWRVQMFGGMARRPEITLDGFKMVICHEIGHHLGGFPMSEWASYEGESDYFSAHVCARKIFRNHVAEVVKVNPWCDWMKADTDKKVCTLTLAAGQSLANLLAVLGGDPQPQLWTPDKSVVSQTDGAHPKAQCRLDTLLAGAQCAKPWDDNTIPMNNGATCDNRPRCWYAP